jgi:hypothetical protein
MHTPKLGPLPSNSPAYIQYRVLIVSPALPLNLKKLDHVRWETIQMLPLGPIIMAIQSEAPFFFIATSEENCIL